MPKKPKAAKGAHSRAAATSRGAKTKPVKRTALLAAPTVWNQPFNKLIAPTLRPSDKTKGALTLREAQPSAPRLRRDKSPAVEGFEYLRASGSDELWRTVFALTSFIGIHALSPIERSQVIESGVPAVLLTRLADEMSISMEKLYATLGVSRATANRALKAQRNLSSADSEHVLGLARLVGQVQQIVEESGNPEGFEAGRWVAEFLEEENPALGGRRPAELMRTSDGRAVVSRLIGQMQSGAYA